MINLFKFLVKNYIYARLRKSISAVAFLSWRARAEAVINELDDLLADIQAIERIKERRKK